MYVGDNPKMEVEKIIKNLRLNLQLRLKFIAHHTTTDEAGGEPSIHVSSTVSVSTPNN